MARVSLRDVDITFHLMRRRNRTSLKDMILHLVRGTKPPPGPVVNAIRGLNLELTDGARLGIVGHNGAGKSTLLRLLAGVYSPTAGVREVSGRVSSMFELSLGFDDDANGWENIRYRGYLLRETPASLDRKINEIAEFTELGEALERPLKSYSSGMLVRLSFAVSTAVEPEILLVDEVLAAGDMAFREKARKRMAQLMDRSSIIVLVSHSLTTVEQICNQVLWMDGGQRRMLGPTTEVLDAYRAYMQEKIERAA